LLLETDLPTVLRLALEVPLNVLDLLTLGDDSLESVVFIDRAASSTVLFKFPGVHYSLLHKSRGCNNSFTFSEWRAGETHYPKLLNGLGPSRRDWNDGTRINIASTFEGGEVNVDERALVQTRSIGINIVVRNYEGSVVTVALDRFTLDS